MFVDFDHADAPLEYQGDVVVIGSGPAGVAIATSLSKLGRQVVLLEAGGVSYEIESQNLYSGRVSGRDYPLETSRLRHFGGTSSHWAGQCAPLRPTDFIARDWLHPDGWPISIQDLAAHYPRAMRFLGMAEVDEDSQIERLLHAAPESYRKAFAYNHTWYWRLDEQGNVSPLRIAEGYADSVGSTSHITCVFHANVFSLSRDNSGRSITGVGFQALQGKRGKATGRVVVLACGGLENPRLLLNFLDSGSLGSISKDGPLGRYFLENPNAVVADAAPAVGTSQYFRNLFLGSRMKLEHSSTGWLPTIAVAPGYQEKHRIAGAYFRFHEYRGRRASLMPLEQPPDNALARGAFYIDNLDEIGHSVLRRAIGTLSGDKPLIRLRVFLEMEQAPHRDNRVTLLSERDRLGLRRINLHWQINDAEVRSARGAVEFLARALGRSGLGRLKMRRWLTAEDASESEEWGVSSHHIGTTRMGVDPATSVLDANCRVHGTLNLYIAGSSVFPTGGFVNPTLTIAALAIRLADHLDSSIP